MLRIIVTSLVLICLSPPLFGQDAQWRGPQRNGIFTDVDLLKTWPEDGPGLLFVTEDLGKGYSSAVATEDVIYTTGIKDSIEYLTAIDMEGNVLWQNPFGLGWNQSFPESRCTPTVDGEHLFVLTGLDMLVCFHAITGEKLWEVDIHKEYKSHWDMFGVSESVLLVDDKVIVTPAGELTTVIALDKKSGKLIWKCESLGAQRSNLSPVLIEHCGQEYIITATRTHMISVDPENGEIMWTYHYNVLDGYLYGSNFTERHAGKWVCMNWHNKGPVISADGMLYCYDEKRGNMGLVKATPKAFELISSFRVREGSGPHWARPAIYNRMLLVRPGKVLAAYQIKEEKDES